MGSNNIVRKQNDSINQNSLVATGLAQPMVWQPKVRLPKSLNWALSNKILLREEKTVNNEVFLIRNMKVLIFSFRDQ